MIRAALAGTLLALSSAQAQWPQPELRMDVLRSHPASVQPGVALNSPLGNYVRATVGAGVAATGRDPAVADWGRVDLLARVVLDPFHQQRWGLSFGGGLTIWRRTRLAALMDLEGPEMAGWRPAIQVGVSGGFRGGLGFRRSVPDRR
jgi:hypothetical protein